MLFVTVPWIGLQMLIWQQHSSRSPFLLPVFNATCFLDVSSCRRNSCHFTFLVDKQSWNSTVWSCLGGCMWLPVALRPLRAHRQNRVGFCHWAQLSSAWRAELQEQDFALLEAVEHHGVEESWRVKFIFCGNSKRTRREPGQLLQMCSGQAKNVLSRSRVSTIQELTAMACDTKRTWKCTKYQ